MAIRISRRQRTLLNDVLRTQRVEARDYRRARMILLAADGNSVSSVARQMGTSRARVTDWLHRFRAEGIDGLHDLARSGRPMEITPLERHQVVAAACKDPRDFGFDREIWSQETLCEAVVTAKLVRSISSTEVGRILEEAEIKPHRVKGWCHSNDPEFQKKMKQIVRLYTKRPKGEPVLCVDEKTGMQALSRSRSLTSTAPRKPRRQEFEYRRHGTTCLFACFNIGTGRVFGVCNPTRTREDFFRFMDAVASTYRQRRVHVVLDNLNTHKNTTRGNFVTDWNRSHGGRFVFHYTPTHGSWLNQVELWFSILARRILRYAQFRSIAALVERVEEFIRTWNSEEARPFRWTYEGLPLVR